MEVALLAPEAAFEVMVEMQASHCFVELELEVEHHALEAVLAGCLSSDPLYRSCMGLALLSLPLLAASALLAVVSGLELVLRCPNRHLVWDAPVVVLGRHTSRHLRESLDSSCCLVHHKTPCVSVVDQSCQGLSDSPKEHSDVPSRSHSGFCQPYCL
jgi:hypothetical protein